jgi:hypothetical protein
MPSYKYYELRGLGRSATTKMPSGMFREVESDGKLWYERITLDGKWVGDNSLIRHIAGYSDEAEEITKRRAAKIEAYFTSGQAAENKSKRAQR